MKSNTFYLDIRILIVLRQFLIYEINDFFLRVCCCKIDNIHKSYFFVLPSNCKTKICFKQRCKSEIKSHTSKCIHLDDLRCLLTNFQIAYQNLIFCQIDCFFYIYFLIYSFQKISGCTTLLLFSKELLLFI